MAKFKKSSDDIELPQVSKIKFSLSLNFNKKFIRDCLVKRDIDIFAKLDWPEAVKLSYRKFDKWEAELEHIISCCKKALEENVMPAKKLLWNRLLTENREKEI